MATVPLKDLPKEYATMDIPKGFKQALGSKNLTRLVTFVDHFEVNNEDYDAIMAEGHRRLPGESDEDLRLRSRLRDDLSKYKHHFYQYSTPAIISAEKQS